MHFVVVYDQQYTYRKSNYFIQQEYLLKKQVKLMQLEQRIKQRVDHPLRYSEYISKDRLLQHLNDLSIDQADQIMQNVRPIRINMMRLTVPNQSKEQFYSKQYRQKQIMRQHSPTRQMYSRQNISQMNRRLKQIRMHNYTPNMNPEQEFDKIRYESNLTSGSDSHRSRTALSSTRLPASNKYQDLRIIPEVRGVATSLQVNSKTSRNFRTAQHRSLKRNVQKKEQQLKKEEKNIKLQPSISYAQYLSKSQLPVQQKVIPNQFKAKLKKKCVQDNINVMASMIKKKVKVLSKNEMYQYINYLINRHVKQNQRN